MTDEEYEQVLRETRRDIYAIRHTLERFFKPSRELSLTLTKLDEACMWSRQIPFELED